jgi:1,4-dihydroxy-2-naphthoate octaprenyltransferase
VANQIIEAQSPEAKILLRDFRVMHNGLPMIAELMGAGKIVNVGPQKLQVRYIHQEDWLKSRPMLVVRWFKAMRVSYLSVSLLPLLVALCATRVLWSSTILITFAIAVFGVTALQIGSQFWNDYEDHMRGIDSPANGGGSGVIQKLWIPAVHLRLAALTALTLGSLAGFALLFFLDWYITKYLLGIGLLGALGAAGYSGWPWHYKYLGLGEVVVFFLAGPLLSIASGLLLTSQLNFGLWYLLIGIPLGILACLRLHTANMQKIPFDVLANSRTLATLLPFAAGKKLMFWTMLLPYIVVLAFIIFKILPMASLLVFASFPLVVGQWKLIRLVKSPLDPLFKELRITTAWLHFVFGLCYATSFLILTR